MVSYTTLGVKALKRGCTEKAQIVQNPQTNK